MTRSIRPPPAEPLPEPEPELAPGHRARFATRQEADRQAQRKVLDEAAQRHAAHRKVDLPAARGRSKDR